MKKIIVLSMLSLLSSNFISAQSTNSNNGGYPKKETINGKKFRVMYYEHVIDKTLEEVWAEVAGNFVHVGKIAKSITKSHCESGNLTEGLGTKRFCAIEFGKQTIEIKEKIIDYQNSIDRKEYTYEVYESKGFPAKVYNTWVVRQGDDGKTYLGTAFKIRANFALMTGLIAQQLKKQENIRKGVLAYKHFLETGERNADPEKLLQLYPIQP